MEQRSTPRQSGVFMDLPIKGMESVVATVSGYQGSERFKLIKLITQAGANYVGALNQSTTHLICWKFEGRKYEIARKLKTIIVNHMWIEDCLRKGRRVPEHSYTLCCGKEIGPLLMDVPLIANKVNPSRTDKSSVDIKSKKHVIDVDVEEDEDALWTDSSLLKENLVPELEKNNKSWRSRRKVMKDCSRQDPLSSARYHFSDPPLSRYTNLEPEELGSSSSTRWLRPKRNTSTVEPSHRGRKLVRKSTMNSILEALSESEEDCPPALVHNLHDDINASPRMMGASNDKLYNRSGNRFDDSEDVEEIKDFNGFPFEYSLSTEVASTSPVIALADQTPIYKDSDEIGSITRLSEPSDLSCVICWTEYSSTRGILPCGHRFCFECIQEWADHMSSSRKPSTCPLCKASFGSITKVDEAVSSDQKIYSQTIPHDQSVDVYILPNREAPTSRAQSSLLPVCGQCCSREPVDLLIRCHLCQIRCIHSYCLDPYMLPWTCSHCKDLRRLYHHIH